jgi:hypothetical protein
VAPAAPLARHRRRAEPWTGPRPSHAGHSTKAGRSSTADPAPGPVWRAAVFPGRPGVLLVAAESMAALPRPSRAIALRRPVPRQPLTRRSAPTEGRVEEFTPVPWGTGPPSASDEGAAWQAAAMYSRFKGRVRTGQSCPPPPLTLSLLHATVAPKERVTPDFRAKLSRGGRYRCPAYPRTRVGIPACVQEKAGVAVRSLIRRGAVAAGPAVMLPGPAAGAAASASAPVPGWSCPSTPNPQIPTGQLSWASCAASNSCVAIGVHVKASGRRASLAEQWNVASGRIEPTPNPPGSAFAALLGVAGSTRMACTALGASTIAGASQPLVERRNGVAWRISHNRASALWPAHACRLAPS